MQVASYDECASRNIIIIWVNELTMYELLNVFKSIEVADNSNVIKSYDFN